MTSATGSFLPPLPAGAAVPPEGAAGCGGVNTQLGVPLASVSSRTSGLVRISRSISIRLLSSGISATRSSTFPTDAISGREKPGGLDSVTDVTSMVGLTDSASLICPSIRRSRPVARFTASTISVL